MIFCLFVCFGFNSFKIQQKVQSFAIQRMAAAVFEDVKISLFFFVETLTLDILLVCWLLRLLKTIAI